MKKTTGKVIIVALVLVTVGIGLFIGGVFAVGGIAAAKAGLSEHGVFVDRGLHIDINRSKSKAVSEVSKVFGGETAAFKLEDVDSLEVEIGAAKMEIISSNSEEEISVRTEGNCGIYLKNGVLHIETNKDIDDTSIVVEIPHNAEFRNAEFEIGAGEIIVEHMSVQKCDASVGVGNFEYHGSILKHGDIECGMGNVELYLEGNEEDYNYEIDCGVGNIDIGDYSIGGVATERTINNHADRLLEIECGMGNVTIDF